MPRRILLWTSALVAVAVVGGWIIERFRPVPTVSGAIPAVPHEDP